MSEIEKYVVENIEANDEPREYQNIDNLKEVIKAILFVSGDGVDISDIIDNMVLIIKPNALIVTIK